ncbi:MAG: hypothetical protein Q7S77_02995 [Candidatus Staskawiczbacteria bacterium]|nr:hypothetical protein [Candidatus Staskawiczbacteria bacterium]
MLHPKIEKALGSVLKKLADFYGYEEVIAKEDPEACILSVLMYAERDLASTSPMLRMTLCDGTCDGAVKEARDILDKANQAESNSSAIKTPMVAEKTTHKV